jgi:hypothetical protein
MSKDYPEKKDADFKVFFKFPCQYVNAKRGPPDAPQWSRIPDDVRAALNDEYRAWHRAYLPTIGPHTPVDTEAKNGAKKAAKKGKFSEIFSVFIP